jgi:hypothetical protein
MAGLSFVTPLAYDWKYACEAIRSYYAIADEIVLGLDAGRVSWSKKPFAFDERAVADFIREIDTEKKIRIIQDNFHAHDLPMDNDTFERRQLGAACRVGNWVVQIDSDEILWNPHEFRSFLSNLNHDVCVAATWVPVYKIIGNKALVVAGRPEATPVATRSPHLYRYARVTGQPYTMSTLQLLHLSWGRTEEELVQKLTNWSHSQEINIGKTVGLWRDTTLENFRQRQDFHPLLGPLWQSLEVVDWPPKSSVEAHVSPPQADAERTRQLLDNPIIVHAKNAKGAVMISFGKP